MDLITRPMDYARYTYQRMMAGAAIAAADIVQALRLRRELSTTVNSKILARHDAIITASGLAPAPRFDEFPADVPPRMTLQTMPWNVTGNPVGRAFDEPTVLRIGAAYEAAAGWISKRPALERPAAV
jgi:aspartyl-tRNA(Asn)/glutamyl-tRNA(Gln) amidotransferase subunit A